MDIALVLHWRDYRSVGRRHGLAECGDRGNLQSEQELVTHGTIAETDRQLVAGMQDDIEGSRGVATRMHD